MKDANIDTKLIYWADRDYNYHVSIGECIELKYVQTSPTSSPDLQISISFASLEEMERVANIMLKAAETARKIASI